MSASEILRKRALRRARSSQYPINARSAKGVGSLQPWDPGFQSWNENLVPDRVPLAKAISFSYGDVNNLIPLPDTYITKIKRDFDSHGSPTWINPGEVTRTTSDFSTTDLGGINGFGGTPVRSLVTDGSETVIYPPPVNGEVSGRRVPLGKGRTIAYHDTDTLVPLPDSYISRQEPPCKSEVHVRDDLSAQDDFNRTESSINILRENLTERRSEKGAIETESAAILDNLDAILAFEEKNGESLTKRTLVEPDMKFIKDFQIKPGHVKSILKKYNAPSHQRRHSNDSDSGFDSSATPPTDRKGTAPKVEVVQAYSVYGQFVEDGSSASPVSSESSRADNPDRISDDHDCTNDDQTDIADDPHDANNFHQMSSSEMTDEPEDDDQMPNKIDTSSTSNDEAIPSKSLEATARIKSILKTSKYDSESRDSCSSVCRSETFTYGSLSRRPNPSTYGSSFIPAMVPRKSISFSAYDRQSKRPSKPLFVNTSEYSQAARYFPRQGSTNGAPQTVRYCQCPHASTNTSSPRPGTKLSSQSFSGTVQNYPYNARWTWKPVARSRTIRTFQPKPVIVRHSQVSRHPSQRVVMYQSMGRNEAYLRLLANQVLTPEETESFKETLHNFRVTKSVPKLCSQLKGIINTVDKMILLVEINNRLPSHLRQDFHRLCSLQFDNYEEVMKRMDPAKQNREKSKVIAQDSSGAIRVLAKGNQKTLVITPQADRDTLRQTATSASESSYTIDQPNSEKSSLFRSDDSFRMFQRSTSSENSEDTLFATLNETNNAIYSEAKRYGDSHSGVYSQPMQLGSSLDSSTASESFETFRHKYNTQTVQPNHILANGPENAGPMVPPSGLQFRPALRHVSLSRSGSGNLGISIKGGKEHNTPVMVQHVEPGSRAEKMGLSPGDIILEVNGHNFQNILHSRAVNIIKSQHNLQMTVTKPRQPQQQTEKIARGLSEPIPVHRLIEKDVTLTAGQQGGLGFSLSGGADQTAAPIISDVFKNSPAEVAGLLKGDRVIKILDIDVRDLTHKQIVALATSSKLLRLRIQRRTQEAARKVHQKGTIHSGNHVSPNGIMSLPNGDGPQFASSPVIRRKSQTSLSIDADDKENNNVFLSNQPMKTQHVFTTSNGHHMHSPHKAHNLKIHASHVHSGALEESDFHNPANVRRKYVRRQEHGPPMPVYRDVIQPTHSQRHVTSPIDHNVMATTVVERRHHQPHAVDINKSTQRPTNSASQKPRRPFSSFIVVPTPNSTEKKEASSHTALNDSQTQRNLPRQSHMNIHSSTRDTDWKI